MPRESYECFACKENDAYRLISLEDEADNISLRSPYARDRDRILYTKSFRSLGQKTQIYLTSESNPDHIEYIRTRLTHTLEVSNIAKTIGSLLNLNCNLIEAISFGHDIGHPPFGHAGEEQLDLFLNGKMPLSRYIIDHLEANRFSAAEKSNKRSFGDFKHNFQSVRQLSYLFNYSFDCDGLNLTFQTMEGILKHTDLNSKFNKGCPCRYPEGQERYFSKLINNTGFQPTLESKIVELTDEITQVCHDLNDAIALGAIPLDKFLDRKEVETAKQYAENHGKKVTINYGKTNDDTNNIIICSALVEYFIRNSYDKIRQYLEEQKRKKLSITDFIDKFPVDPEPKKHFCSLQEYKDNLVINNYNMNRMDNKGKYIIRKLIEAYVCDPRQLPDSVLRRYANIKLKEIRIKKEQYVKEWFENINIDFGVKEDSKIKHDQIDSIVKLIDTDSEGTIFRKIDSQLLQKLKVYIALDADYLRCIADYIATLSDVSAEREMIALYGH